MQPRRGLGRGLESLLPPPPAAVSVSETKEVKGIQTIPIDKVIPNRLQPRTVFDDEKIKELAESIRIDGIIQPLIVSQAQDGRYELIAGERRLRASRLAGLTEVPVIVKFVDQANVLALSLIENIQREDLNVIEESLAYKELIETFGLTQEEVAKRVGKSRVAVANSLRFLNLPQIIKDDVVDGKYSAGHARALLNANGIHEQLKLREWIVRTTPTVRIVEKKVASSKERVVRVKPDEDVQIVTIVNRMRELLGTKIKILKNKKGGGKVTIDYYSWQDLNRLYRRIVGE